MNEYIWECFDSLWQTVHRLSHRLGDLETRIATLEAAATAEDPSEDSLDAGPSPGELEARHQIT
jgi:BMFP domain-containing protein YqiC